MKLLPSNFLAHTRGLSESMQITRKSAASNHYLPRVLVAVLLFGTAGNTIGAKHKTTFVEQVYKNHSMPASASFSARELENPTGFCCKKAGCKKCNTKQAKPTAQCDTKKFATWCQDGVAGEKCSPKRCVNLEKKSPQPTGHCCKKTGCKKCKKKNSPRDKCNSNNFIAWCEGGVIGKKCPKSKCFSLGATQTASPTTSPTTSSPTSSPVVSPTTSPNAAPTPAPMDLDCSMPAETKVISMPQGSWNTNWLALTLDKAVRASIKALQVQVKTPGGGGNKIYILEEWSNPPILTYTMPDGTPTVQIDLPEGKNARLQLWIENIQKVAYVVQLSLCKERDVNSGM